MNGRHRFAMKHCRDSRLVYSAVVCMAQVIMQTKRSRILARKGVRAIRSEAAGCSLVFSDLIQSTLAPSRRAMGCQIYGVAALWYGRSMVW